MWKWMQSIAHFIDRRLFTLSKRITRKGFEEFLVGNLILFNPETSLYVLNIGAGGSVAQLVSRGLAARSVETQAIVALDLNPHRKPDIAGDAVSLPLTSASFDCVVCAEILEHVHSPAACLKEIRRVLKPGGMLLLSTRFIYPLHDRPYDYFRYTKYGLSLLLQSAGFHHYEILEQHNWLQTFSVLMVRAMNEGRRLFRAVSRIIVVPLAYGLYCLGALWKEPRLDFVTSGYFVLAEA